ncbi:MAG: hypothetical protein KatS3mg108_0968 [Isosphaeraceae bacterium]|nr:MAG: hypothetical protein KatS3mg108_0968 [Isosphaeraceae bacterium]
MARRPAGYLLIGLGLFAATAWSLSRAGVGAAPPRLVLPRVPLDLGRGKVGEVLDGHFAGFNGGGSPLVVELVPSCGCSDLNPRRLTLEPGEARDVRVGIRLQEEGLHKTVSVTLNSNDPESPSRIYAVSAECLAPLRLSARSVAFGRVPAGRGGQDAIRVRDADDRPIGADVPVTAESDHPHVEAEVARDAGSGDLRLLVTLRDDAPAGHVAGVIRLRREEPPAKVAVVVSAEVVGAIQVAPAWVDLLQDVEGEAYVLAWRPGGGALGPVERVEAPEGVQVDEPGAPVGPRRRLRLRRTSPIPPKAEIVRVWFRDLSEPGVIRLTSSPLTPGSPEAPAAEPVAARRTEP